jgi:hypothetical protein
MVVESFLLSKSWSAISVTPRMMGPVLVLQVSSRRSPDYAGRMIDPKEVQAENIVLMLSKQPRWISRTTARCGPRCPP